MPLVCDKSELPVMKQLYIDQFLLKQMFVCATPSRKKL